MPAKKYIVELDAGERELLTGFISTGRASAKAILKARLLLKADEAEGGPGWLDSQIVEALDTNLTMVMRTREKFVTDGLDAVLARKKRLSPPTPPIFDGEAQAKLTALACSEPPEGHARWTIRLLVYNRRKTDGVVRIAARVIESVVATPPLTMRNLIDCTRPCRRFASEQATPS